MEISGLFYIALILFIMQFFFGCKEGFQNDKQKPCSQLAINDAYSQYIFTQPKFVRP